MGKKLTILIIVCFFSVIIGYTCNPSGVGTDVNCKYCMVGYSDDHCNDCNEDLLLIHNKYLRCDGTSLPGGSTSCCVSTCPETYYLSRDLGKGCYPCRPGCKMCNYTTVLCFECIANMFLFLRNYNESRGTCTSDCTGANNYTRYAKHGDKCYEDGNINLLIFKRELPS